MFHKRAGNLTAFRSIFVNELIQRSLCQREASDVFWIDSFEMNS
jgi:hypothetical protein